MKLLKKIMQVGLAVFFLGLLATNTVLADTTGGQFAEKDNRKYYIKDENKAIYWHKIDGKMYYFGGRGEMVVGWQYLEIPGTGYRDNLFSNNPVLEIGLQHKWYYFGQDGTLQEYVGWKQLDAKGSLNVGKKFGEPFEGPEVLRYANYYFDEDHSLKTGWIYNQSNWYYLAKTGDFGNENLGGERRAGWIQDDSTWYYLDTTTAAMQTGWKYLDNKWYYLHSSGAMKTGWVQEDLTWYYLDENNGNMKTGWFQVNGKWYYAYSSGDLAVNTTIDGYSVNHNGEWIN